METTTEAPAPKKTTHPAPRSRTMADILKDLRKPIPDRLIKTKTTGTYKADYVSHVAIRDLLDYYAPGWEAHKSITHGGGKLYVTTALSLHGSDMSITRYGIGNEDDDHEGYGDPSSNADAQALRRAAMEFGLGRSLWRK